MDVITYIRQCVEKYIQMTDHQDSDLVVFVSQDRRKRYWFVQIGPLIFIPNTQDIPFNGVFLRTSDSVEGWESFDETGVIVPPVRQILMKRKGKVGPFFYVKQVILAEILDLNNAEIYGDFRISPVSHLDVWDKKYVGIYRKPYDYYPRGRVVYRYKEGIFVVYADRCIDEKGISDVLKTFDIEDLNYRIERTDEHYVCKTCNEDYFE